MMFASPLLACLMVAASMVGVVADKAFNRERIASRLAPDSVRFFEPSEIASIKAFSAAGNKIVVAYCANKRLAEFMGVEVGPWYRLPSASAAIGTGDGKVLSNYRTGCVFPPSVPANNRLNARVGNWLLDENLRSLGIPASIVTDRGIWYAHDVPPKAMTGGKMARLPGAMRIRGVWTSGAPLCEGGWKTTARKLSASGFNAVFIKSTADNFDAVLRACKNEGLQVHAWIIAFGGESGRLPDNKGAREYVLKEARRMAAKKVDGIQLDYFRYPSKRLSSEAMRKRGSVVINSALVEILSPLRKEAKGLKLSVAVYPIPRSQLAVGQDVAAWFKTGLVDFVSPMCYEESVSMFASRLAENLAVIPADKIVVGIGAGANESRLDDVGLQKQVDLVYSKKLAGLAVFALDAELASRLRD